jgi:hypothetical protein
MRYQEISGGFRVPVSEEEQEMLDLARQNGKLFRDQLAERQAEVARLMVSRGLFNRFRRDGRVYYQVNIMDAWRF